MRVIIVLVVLTILASSAAYKLNVPKILLPRRISKSIPPINYTLAITDIGEGITGCFQWRSSRPEVAEIYPIYDQRSADGKKCSNHAIVSAISEQTSRRTAIISAEDIHSGFGLRCDVIVDSIHSFEIVTTTRQLYLEDSPELFIVRAKNDEGDTFADLDGLEFDWLVDSASPGIREKELSNQTPARIVSFAESEYETTPAIRLLEAQGLRGDRILVEGLSTGVALISVRGRDEWKNVPPYSIQLTVMALLTLEPSADIRVPIGSRIQYSLKLIRYRKAENIPLPSPQYRIQLVTIEAPSENSVARFDERTSVFEALSLGTVQLRVEDRKLELTNAVYDLPTVYIYVVEPASILFTVSTGVWVFEVGKSYDISVILADSQNRPLYMAENMVMDVQFPIDLLRSTSLTTRNGTFWRVKALKEGSGDIEAKHDTYLDMHGRRQTSDPVITGQQHLEIYEPLSINPALVVFPSCYEAHLNHIGAVEPCFEQRLMVTGGSGRFIWTLEDGNNSAVNPARMRLQASGGREAIISTFEGGPAKALAVVSDMKNRQHKATTKIIVANPTKAEFLDGPREVEIGSTLYLGLRVYGSVRASEERLIPFSDCNRMLMDIRISDNAAVQFTKPQSIDTKREEFGDACVILPFTATAIGDVIVTVDIAPRGTSAGDSKLTISTGISVYAPLKIVSPADNQLLLTPTSSYVVVFAGGPRPIPNDYSNHFVAVERIGKTATDYFETSPVSELSTDEHLWRRFTFNTLCVSGTPVPSEGSVLISVGNKNTSTNKYPALSTATLKVICDFPNSISLRLKRKQRPYDEDIELPPCPLDAIGNTDPKPVYAGSKFDVLVEIYDHARRKFDNASAVQFVWQVSDTSLIRAPSSRAHALRWRNTSDMENSFELFETFHPSGQEGASKLTVEVANVVEDACSSRARKLCEEFLKRSLRSSISLRLVYYATLEPSTAVLYNHPSSQVIATIRGGSGRFHVSVDKPGQDMISWTSLDSTQKLKLTPAGSGTGETVLKIYDICLIESPPAEATIAVSSIEKLSLFGPSLVMLGSAVTLHARAFDSSGHQFSSEDVFNILPLDIRIEGGGLVRHHSRDGPVGTFSFDAIEVDVANVVISVTDVNTGRTIRSTPHRVQVFPAFEIEPREITLIAGAHYQLRITGGLQHSPMSLFADPIASGVTFSLNDSKIIGIAPDGLIDAKRPGTASVIATLANPERADDILAQDTAIIHIAKLAAIKINAPTTSVYTGSIIPLNFVGIGDQMASPRHGHAEIKEIVFPWGTAGADHPLKASWSTDGDGAEIGFNDIDSVSGTVYLNCTKAGVIHIRLSVEQPNKEWSKLQFASGILQRSMLNASHAITVVDELRFKGPEGWKHDGTLPPRLIVSPNSTVDLDFTHHLRGREIQIYGTQENVLPSGHNSSLRTTSNIGDGAVVVSGVRSDAPDFDETVAFTISVQPVSYLLATSALWSVWKEKKWSHVASPVSYTLKFSINYYDHRGLRFDAFKWPRRLGVRPNRFDLVDISVATERNQDILVVRLKELGETVIKIWDIDRPTTVFEYLRLNSIRAIQPAVTEIPIGQKICFTNALWKSDGQFAWSTSDRNVLDIDSETGIALAKSPGYSIISQTINDAAMEKFTTSTVINVLEPTSISLTEIGAAIFMDTDDDPEHIFAVHFDDAGHSYDCAAVSKLEEAFTFAVFPFNCELQVSPPAPSLDLFNVKSAYVPTVGLACVVKRRSTVATSTQSNPWTDNRNISILASRGALFSHKLTFPVYAPLIIEPIGLLLIDNEGSYKANVHVVAPNVERSDHLKVTLSMDARNLFVIEELKRSKRDAQTDASKKDYSIRLRPDAVVDVATIGGKNIDLHVAINDETTAMVKRIPIRLKLHAKPPSEDESKATGILGVLWNFLLGAKEVYGNVVLIVVTAALTIFSVYFGYKFVTNAAMKARDASSVPAYSPVSPASVPWRSYNAQNARSPQLWSLDRSQNSPSSDGSPKTASLGSFVTRR